MTAFTQFTATQMADDHAVAPRVPGKARIAIMGEFSAGKSTLSNMLIGRQALPIKVTATQLPPVWISYGDQAPYRRGLDGEDTPVDLSDIEAISPGDTEFIRIFHRADTLQLFDLIDLPGISDPNMPPEVWERVMRLADAVIWCTHATQAWRQSEAAVWESFSDRLAGKSLLLVTRFDKINGERDRERVIRRLKTETEGLFRDIYPISLTQALAAETNFELWDSSGAEALATALIEMSRELAAEISDDAGTGAADDDGTTVQVLHRHRQPASPVPNAPQVVPRRVVVSADSARRSARLKQGHTPPGP